MKPSKDALGWILWARPPMSRRHPSHQARDAYGDKYLWVPRGAFFMFTDRMGKEVG